MNGKTFLRTVGFAQSYGHGWANALLSEAACEDPITGTFSKAANIALFDPDEGKRTAAEADLEHLTTSLEQQEKLIEAADRFLTEQEGDIPGIRAASCFCAKEDGLHYDHITGSGRLEVWVHEGVAEFSISRPGEQDLFCVSVDLASRSFRIYSGESDSFLAEDHDACVRRWEKHLRLRHVWALTEAVTAFFGTESDRELRADVLAAIRTEAASVFREQEDTVELSCWDREKGRPSTVVFSEHSPFATMQRSESPLSKSVRMALLQEFKRIDACERDVLPAFIPFDYSPSSPDASFFREFFRLPEEGIRYEDMQGTLMIRGDASYRYPGGHYDAELLFAAGVSSDDVERCVAKHADEDPRDALLEGLKDAIAEREGKGTFAVQRDVSFCVNYPVQSLTALGGDWNALGVEPWDEKEPA